MLPLLPALILLLLQGPANVERMAWDGELPGALRALHRQMASSKQRAQLSGPNELALATLIAMSGDETMSRALWQLVALAEPSEIEPVIDAAEDSPPPEIPEPPHIGDPRDGFLDCRRTRDGPQIA